MAKKFTYKTQGTCSKSIEIELEGDIVKSVRFEGGCHGSTQGIGLLTRGMQAADVIARLEGIDCKGRGTSCPDQLAKALASGPRTITATTKPENGPVLQNPGKQRKNKSSYTVSRTAPGNGAADVCRSPGPIAATDELNERESAALPGRGKNRNLFGKVRWSDGAPDKVFRNRQPDEKRMRQQ